MTQEQIDRFRSTTNDQCPICGKDFNSDESNDGGLSEVVMWNVEGRERMMHMKCQPEMLGELNEQL